MGIEIIDNFVGKDKVLLGPKTRKRVRIEFYKDNSWHQGEVLRLAEAREKLKVYEEKGMLKYPKYRIVEGD